MKISKNVSQYVFGIGSVQTLSGLVEKRRIDGTSSNVVYVVDCFFSDKKIPGVDVLNSKDLLIWVDTKKEPTISAIDLQVLKVKTYFGNAVPCAVVGIGGGCTLDTAKAISNLLTNEGTAADYQGWDLLKQPGVFKIGVPTVSGTGAEASRTCVMTNEDKNIKLGMNSEHSIFDHLILDPALTRTVPRDQYLFSAMDTYIHCIESLNGKYRHSLADSFSREAIELCREVFHSDDMMSDLNREKLMAASYLGGSSIANTFVGVVHPLSAGLSTALGTHHCLSNCIVMNVIDDFYPKEAEEFRSCLRKQNIVLPSGLCSKLTDEEFANIYKSAIIHEKPLRNALGDKFREILTYDRVKKLYSLM